MVQSARQRRKLSQVVKPVSADLPQGGLVVPDGIVTSDWPKMRRTCRSDLGVTLDGWQEGMATLLFGRREGGALACTIGGLGASIMRQVGKTYGFAAIFVTLCLYRPGTKLLWTSHHNKTSGETFLAMQAFCQQPLVKRFIKRIYLGSGDEEVRFSNGSRILFGARERGFGIGIPRVDGIMFDEGQILSAKALENLVATMNQSQLGLHLYVGTPPKPGDMCDVFVDMRTKAQSGLSKNLVWIEMGADEDADLDDLAVYAVNPSYPHWTPLESMQRLREVLGPDAFRRQGLGIWPRGVGTRIDLVAWTRLEDRDRPAPARVVVTVVVAPYQVSAALGIAGVPADGKKSRTAVATYSEPGMGWIAAKIAELEAARTVAEVWLCPGEARGASVDLVQIPGLDRYEKMSVPDIAASCTAFQSAIKEAAMTHYGQPALDTGIAAARTRRSGSGETWEEDTAPEVIAAAAALFKWHLSETAPYDVLASVL